MLKQRHVAGSRRMMTCSSFSPLPHIHSFLSAPMAPSFLRPPPPRLPHHRASRLLPAPPSASFRLADLLGARGLCNGELGIRKELSSTASPSPSPSPTPATTEAADSRDAPPPPPPPPALDPDAFEKEMMGLTGGFPGGEVGLKDFVANNPPPPPPSPPSKTQQSGTSASLAVVRPRPPELPLFLPGMVVLVKNPANAYHMYCGIVQRVTDGKVGVLFEGGNWDRLITFAVDELEGREKGPPMVNPKSVVLEALVADLDDDDEEPDKKKEREDTTAAAKA